MRGGETIEVTDVPDVLPDVDLAPGETVVAVMIHEFDICTAEGVGVFDTQVDVLAGPPCDVEVGKRKRSCLTILSFLGQSEYAMPLSTVSLSILHFA